MNLKRQREMLLAVEAAYGRAVLASHILERRLILHVSAWHALRNRDLGAFKTMQDSLLKKPLGDIIRIGKASGAFPDDAHEALERARTLRNHLVHEITDSILLKFFTKQGSSDIVAQLLGMADDFEGISNEIAKMAYLCLDIAGVPINKLQKHSRSLVRRLSQANSLEEVIAAKCR